MWWPALTQRSYNCVPLLHSPGPPVLSATAPWPRSSGFSLSAFVPRSTSWFWSCSPSRAWSSTPHYASALPPSGLGGVWDSFGRLEGAYVMTGFGVCFMFLFSFILFCNLIHAVSVMLPVPSCISALCMCHVVIWLLLSCAVFLIGYCSVMWFSVLFAHWLVLVTWPLVFAISIALVAIMCIRLEAALRRMISVWRHSTTRAIWEQMDPYAFESL